ncbi:ABC transporter permease [Mycolicibacterium flavescens]|uniref:Glutamine ABC transporter permease n=1 Tax=Mycolicibacterium flavescens TaxID=1776 RepID=A0A1E3RPU6_MYCFV|nr:ABC transporter permease [Mycolicibacterium flavescens]MCV7283194.1 ABC transporter permease [Mycolicibacterium flavescens]ODQ91879.1 glutamine ABC transporter permease [Mycolicibacterium flavescens]
MLIAALRDMQWRKRRFAIAVVSTAIIFGMTLVLTGLANGFQTEAERTVDSLGVDEFVIKAGASGPFVGATPFAPVELRRIAAAPGVEAAAPLAYAGGTATLDGDTRNIDIFGAPEDGPGMPAVIDGRVPRSPDEVAVSTTLGRGVGDEVEIASRRLTVTGLVDNSTALANLPNVFLTIPGAQQLVYGGEPLVASIGVRGALEQVPDGYRVLDRAGAIEDLLRPLRVAVNSITIVAVLLWIVAALIVGSVVYLSALERLRDFAVFKAIGVPTRSVMAGLALQAVIVALLAALLGAGLSLLLGPLFPMQVIVPVQAFVALPVIAVVIGLLASAAGLRRAVKVDPALAFGGP